MAKFSEVTRKHEVSAIVHYRYVTVKAQKSKIDNSIFKEYFRTKFNSTVISEVHSESTALVTMR